MKPALAPESFGRIRSVGNGDRDSAVSVGLCAQLMSSLRRCRRDDDRGEAFPVAILFVFVLLTILIGIHVVLVALARTAVQAAADSAVSVAQVAESGQRADEGRRAAESALAAAQASVRPTEERPEVNVYPERGSVEVVVFGAVNTPVLGTLRVAAQACAPLDDIPASQLTSDEPWECPAP